MEYWNDGVAPFGQMLIIFIVITSISCHRDKADDWIYSEMEVSKYHQAQKIMEEYILPAIL